MNKKILIVGGVAGGASTAARLRRLDENANIIMFERGDYISYANCGLPYHIGNVIKSRDSLLLQSPEAMLGRYNIDVRIKQEVVAIDRKKKIVTVKNVESGDTYRESYDTLVLSTGSSPFKAAVSGINASRIMTLWTVPDADRIREFIADTNAKNVLIVGGGFIGLEMAENLHHAGLQVTLADMLDQVMAPLDFEMAQLLHEQLELQGITLLLGDAAASFEQTDTKVNASMKSGKVISSDLVILSIGVKPNSDLAREAGLELSTRGAVIVDEFLRTSDPDIFAVGDVIEVEDFVTRQKTMIPLAGPANKQGRIVANNICGEKDPYCGTQGTSIVKIFDLTAASTGVSEKTLKKSGLTKGKDYESIIITQNSHAGYYPGATPMTLKLLFSMDGKKLFGAQIVGREGIDKRIDILSTAIRLGAGVEDLKALELAYAPPFSSAKDPVNMAGFVAENVLKGKIVFCEWDAVEKQKDALILDVREDAERMAFAFPGSLNIPWGQLRQRAAEIDKQKTLLVFCAIGVRSYNAARTLMQLGFEKVLLYPGGTNFYQSTHYKELLPEASVMASERRRETEPVQSGGTRVLQLDCSGLQCPGPIMKVFETMNTLKEGDTLEVSASDPGFARDIVAWCRRTGNTLISNEKRGNEYVATVQKGGRKAPETKVHETPDGKTIIVFSGDMDKVLASFIIANGAAAMGRRVTMFFTFWGLNVLRRSNRQKVPKSFIESMFGAMMPRGAGKLKLSKMHMAGMGTAMMKMVMKRKNIDSLQELIRKAMAAGVKMVACTMSMDVMGIREEELIDGVQLGGVGAYLGDAEESNVNLFI
ncbi:MAG: DsrE/DsrF/DrsH-like family protein [Candidatus Neomarinimicrobiota bacterium]|jgi:NADPH-dependent 2,4-dienoyl-CoA reductase/sulfur reductase-like enzyme/peroxiredoxin family protein/TusA-related sulfurtransferase/rhodanese-related sulfurtransferase|nr:DsrE/DsrF/DrsH-like family protein [Candidatus Neomarinimicrobiota bacterium]